MYLKVLKCYKTVAKMKRVKLTLFFVCVLQFKVVFPRNFVGLNTLGVNKFSIPDNCVGVMIFSQQDNIHITQLSWRDVKCMSNLDSGMSYSTLG